MFNDSRGPIKHFDWGEYLIDGEEHSKSKGKIVGAGKDIRVIGKDVSAWEEREGHKTKLSMITGVYDQDIEVLIIGTGIRGRIECSQKVQNSIKKRGIERVIIETTPKACETYNRLFHEGKRVALLAHGTC